MTREQYLGLQHERESDLEYHRSKYDLMDGQLQKIIVWLDKIDARVDKLFKSQRDIESRNGNDTTKMLASLKRIESTLEKIEKAKSDAEMCCVELTHEATELMRTLRQSDQEIILQEAINRASVDPRAPQPIDGTIGEDDETK